MSAMIKTLKLLRATVPYMAAALATACGGGGAGTPSVMIYSLSATAGAGGSIVPSSATVNAGATTTFTVTPNSGYTVSSITGCGGSLSGSTYTTGATNANCTVTASFSAAWIWVSGSNTANGSGVYGTQGMAANSNVPGARIGAFTWTDAEGNLWLYGGYGEEATLIFSDMWKYSPASGEWTWVGGSSTPNATAVFGTLGVAATTNTPGGIGSEPEVGDASSAPSWTDANGNMWLFGGYGYDSTGATGWLNALWEYSPTSGMWTWYGGSKTVNAPGVYGTQGVAAATNFPGARTSSGWKDTGGNIWLFGGFGPDGIRNDLWEYSPSSRQWTWVSGSNTTGAKGVYGTRGVAATTNVPSACSGVVWTDASGNVWLFGGFGVDPTSGRPGILNTLWEYSPSSHQWTWVGGSNMIDALGVYGTQGVAAATNVPGARELMAHWTDTAGNLWLFGGSGFDSKHQLDQLNDLWKYSLSSHQWTWVGGSNMIDAMGVYGTQDVAAATNVPGARNAMVTWTDDSSVWLFGGQGFYPSSGVIGPAPEWNDLWKYPIQ